MSHDVLLKQHFTWGQGYIELLKRKQKYYKISFIMKIREHVLTVCFMKTVYQINNLIT